MDMQKIYVIAVVGGFFLLLLGAYGLSRYKQTPLEDKHLPESEWLKHYNEYQNNLSPLEQQWNDLNSDWWVYYNQENWNMCKEANDKMKILADQMHVLHLKYKATQTND